jgi:penicillin G amidase
MYRAPCWDQAVRGRLAPMLVRLSCVALLLAGCSCGDPPAVDDGGPPDAGPGDPAAPAPLDQVEESARFELPCLSEHAHSVSTELDVPHLYAANRTDAMCVLGFVMARDRFFQMDMTRRLSQGRISEILGEPGLETDIQSRQTGGAFVTSLYENGLNAEETAEVDAFAAGINAYIEAVRTRAADPPTEYEIGFALLGARRPVDLMIPWTRRDVVATGATVLYATSFETGDVGRALAHQNVDAHFPEFPDRELRLAGLRNEIMDQYAPPNDSSSAAGFGLETSGSTSEAIIRERLRRPIRIPARAHIEGSALERSIGALARLASHWPRDPDEGYGSNAWAVAGTATEDGSSLIAGDGHLQLSVPPLFWQFGLDTVLIGGASERTRMLGGTIAGLPMMGVGTNGRIAWSQTAYFADVTDWYAEVIVLDEAGMPSASVFEGEERPLVRTEDVFEVRDVPELDSVGRTETIVRFNTFDGRWINSIEGRTVTVDEPLEPGESRINLMGEWIVPGDVDGDGDVTAVSFYYGPFDGGTLLRAFRLFSLGDTVEDFREAMRHFIGYGGSMIASDSAGSIYYSAYHAVPGREHLPRDGETNEWLEGADPRRLIDGTRFGSWSIPLDAEGRVDEAAAEAGEPRQSVVPFAEWPAALDPDRQYVQHANNDPGNITTDNDIFDDPYYIGGPWIEGYRAERIEERLSQAIAAGNATVEEMASIQADQRSNLGIEWVPFLLEVIEAARTAAAGDPAPGTPEARMAAAWDADQAAYEEVEARMIAWRDAGHLTPSGVETFYETEVTAQEIADSVATTIFNHWFPRFVGGVLGDEGIDTRLSPAVTGDTYRMQTMLLLVTGRGAGNPNGLDSWEPARLESVFFDDVTTPGVTESSNEIALRALTESLALLRGAPTSGNEGGFGTPDMDAWLWGLRHQVRFESLLADFIGEDPSLAGLLEMFSISTDRVPLAPDLPEGDPRAALDWFPRPGDQFGVDAGNPGLDGTNFTYASGPVFRMVIALGPNGVRGQNIVPGGQSGRPGGVHFADQARLWLANETIPMRYLPEEVVEGAIRRERFAPAD